MRQYNIIERGRERVVLSEKVGVEILAKSFLNKIITGEYKCEYEK